jgi:hypothetical protein
MKIGSITMIPRKKMVCGIPVQKKFKTQASAGKVMLTILEMWRCCTDWLPGKRYYSDLRVLYCNTKNSQKMQPEEGGRNWWRLASARQFQASHKCWHIWSHCMFGVYSATTKILLLVISTCSTNRRNTSGTKTSVLNKKSRLQCTSVFGESERIF